MIDVVLIGKGFSIGAAVGFGLFGMVKQDGLALNAATLFGVLYLILTHAQT